MLTRIFATLKLLVVWVTLGPILGVVGMTYTLIVGDITWLYWNAMRLIRAGLRTGGVRVSVSGLENLQAGRRCIFMANHCSNLDPPVLIPLIPQRCSVLLKKELMNIPILGRAMKMGGYIPVERGHKREAAQASVAAAGRALDSGLHILVFPEGTRSVDGRLATFKKGPFFLAMQTGAPIIPVAISGTQRLMGKGSSLVTPGEVSVRMLEAIDPAGFTTREELTVAVRAAIARGLPEGMRPLV